jgi:hypothetical protein
VPRAPKLAVPKIAAIAAAALATSLAVSACGTEHAGAAATVGDTRISVSQVKAGADVMLKDQGTQESASADANLQRSVLSRIIKDTLLDRAASDKGVAVSEGDVKNELADAAKQSGGQTQLESAAAQQGIAKADLHDYIYYALLEQKLGEKLTSGQIIKTAHLSVIMVADKATADKAVAEIGSDPSKFPAAAKKYSTNTASAAQGGDIGQIPVDTLPEPIKTDVTTKAEGTIFEETIQGTYYVIYLQSRDDTPISELSGTQAAAQTQQAAVTKYLGTISASDHVTVSPRYGSWDAETLAVVPSTGKLSSPLSSPSG